MSEQEKKDQQNKDQTRPLEEIFQELDDLLEKMQSPEVTLEESFACYEKGMKDIRQCTALLDQIEKKMLVLSADGETMPFDEAPNGQAS